MRKNRAVVPGSFDPVTYGHLDIIERAQAIFDEVVVAVIENRNKNQLFDLVERAEMLRDAVGRWPTVSVDTFSGLLVEYMKKERAQIIVRGLRVMSDFEYELQLALINRELDPDVETFFLAASGRYSFLSSRVVKEIASYGGQVTEFVPPKVEARLKEKYLLERG
ncbi:MAG: pantetheine-phosphate adenylyltransferase [Coprothermobacterota bacterium]|nr:pantetheine-phosphate adenylyltransferase [Coprothermobacterota bacterium]